MATKIDFTKKKKKTSTATDAISASSTISKLRKVTSEEEALEEIFNHYKFIETFSTGHELPLFM